MKNLTKSDFTSIQFDHTKTTLRKTGETFESLNNRGYETVSKLSGNETLPSYYYYSKKENRMFLVQMSGVSEVIKMQTRFKRNQPYRTIFQK